MRYRRIVPYLHLSVTISIKILIYAHNLPHNGYILESPKRKGSLYIIFYVMLPHHKITCKWLNCYRKKELGAAYHLDNNVR
jgi:hypothetical protein